MTTQSSAPGRPLRLWPAFLILAFQWIVGFVVPMLFPEAEPFGLAIGILGVGAAALGGLLMAIWWLFFSRAYWSERVGAIVLMVVAVMATRQFTHPSISGAGMGNLMYVMSVPYLCLALVIWAAATARLSDGMRRALLVAVILLAVAPWTAIRTDGVSDVVSQYHWRWTPTAEEVLLAQEAKAPEAPVPAPAPAAVTPAPSVAATAEVPAAAGAVIESSAPAAMSEPMIARAEWPGFRGPERDGAVRGVRINTDWSASPPVQMWRRPIGPGWSSFSVNGDVFYTQEQRGEEEIVSCHRVSTGALVWRHSNRVRFFESNGGAGPRSTPTIHGNRVFASGATGILDALDAATGKLLWSADVARDTGRSLPIWGFTSSPLVVNDLVVTATSGTLAAYDLATGQRRWTTAATGGSYSSPQLATIAGVDQILLLASPGAISVDPKDGTLLWKHEWEGGAIVQPALTADGDILVNAMSATGGLGTRRLHVSKTNDGWTVEERWTTNGLKPYFNDLVLHKGHAYGFDNNIMSSINLADGKRNWKGGRYGNGQVVLLPDQDLLLVISEEGELVLVSATPDKHAEIARFQVLDGKTWNHPVIVGDILLVRNGEEMAAFRLSLLDRY